MRVYDNGIYRDATPEEIAAIEQERENAPIPEPTAEERLAALETRMEQADIDRAALVYLLTGEGVNHGCKL